MEKLIITFLHESDICGFALQPYITNISHQ